MNISYQRFYSFINKIFILFEIILKISIKIPLNNNLAQRRNFNRFKFRKYFFKITEGKYGNYYLEIIDKKSNHDMELVRLNSSSNYLSILWEVCNIVNTLISIPNKKTFESLLKNINYKFINKLNIKENEINYILDNTIKNKLCELDKLPRYQNDCFSIEVFNKKQNICSIFPSNNFWCADPFLLEIKNKYFLLFERYNPNTKNGQIDYISLSNLGSDNIIKADSNSIKTLIKIKGKHLAYPSPTINPKTFKINKNKKHEWILVDNFSENTLIRYKVELKSEEEIEVKTSIGIKKANLIDPIIVEENDEEVYVLGNYLLSRECCVLKRKKKIKKHFFKKSKSQDIKCRLPLHFAKSRNAGRFFLIENKLYRPVQITSPSYGSGLFIEKYSDKKKLLLKKRLDRIHHIDLASYPFYAFDYYFGIRKVKENLNFYTKYNS